MKHYLYNNPYARLRAIEARVRMSRAVSMLAHFVLLGLALGLFKQIFSK